MNRPSFKFCSALIVLTRRFDELSHIRQAFAAFRTAPTAAEHLGDIARAMASRPALVHGFRLPEVYRPARSTTNPTQLRRPLGHGAFGVVIAAHGAIKARGIKHLSNAAP